RFCFLPRGLRFECLEPAVPEAVEEVPQLDEPFGTGPVEASGAVASLAHEPRLLQDVQVLGDCRPRDLEMRRDLAGAELVLPDEAQDRAPSRFGDGLERSLHGNNLSRRLRKRQLNYPINGLTKRPPPRQTGGPGDRGGFEVKSHVRGLVLLISVLAVVVLGGAGGSTASTTSHCNTPAPTGRQFCITVEDIDGDSPSGHVGTGVRQNDVTAYQFYKFTVQNVGGSSLTNG